MRASALPTVALALILVVSSGASGGPNVAFVRLTDSNGRTGRPWRW